MLLPSNDAHLSCLTCSSFRPADCALTVPEAAAAPGFIAPAMAALLGLAPLKSRYCTENALAREHADNHAGNQIEGGNMHNPKKQAGSPSGDDHTTHSISCHALRNSDASSALTVKERTTLMVMSEGCVERRYRSCRTFATMNAFGAVKGTM